MGVWGLGCVIAVKMTVVRHFVVLCVYCSFLSIKFVVVEYCVWTPFYCDGLDLVFLCILQDMLKA